MFLFNIINIELKVIAINNIEPPIKVSLVAPSPKNIQTQIGANNTSQSDNRVNSAAGTVLDPIVYRIKPIPTWKTPKNKA